jgi:hypothetical protein
LACGTLAFADSGDSLVELVFTADDQAAREPDVLEDDFRGVRSADSVLLELLSLFEA